MDQFQTEFASPIPMQKPESSFSILSEKQSVEAVSCLVSTFSRKNDRVNVSIGGVWISFLLIQGYRILDQQLILILGSIDQSLG